MITPPEIKQKSLKKYYSVLRKMVEHEPFEKLVIRCNKKYSKSSLQEFENEIQAIINESKEKKGFGYSLEFQRVKTKFLSQQDLPVSIYFDTEKDFLKFLGKKQEAELFKTDFEEILRIFPELKDWVIQNPKMVIDNHSNWQNILKVCNYFKQTPKPNLYIRELPINVHTKFIERNQNLIKKLLPYLIPESINHEEEMFEKRFNLKHSEPQVRFKILDNEISRNYFSGINDCAIPLTQFEELNLPISKIIIVENKTSLYTTLTLPNMDKTIAIFGSGYNVLNLKNVKWLQRLKIIYWGDIDAQGFEILSNLRSYFKHTKSLLMDENTFDQFFENDFGTPSKISSKLNLSDKEQKLYEKLNEKNYRLEQEKLPYKYVIGYIESFGINK